MVNIDDFIKRLEIVMDYYALSASAFADKIDVQRSSISHLLSGRNKPSLDFILKVIEVFPDVDLYWILNGKGTFPKSEKKMEEKSSAPILENWQKEENSKSDKQADLFSTNETIEKNSVFENSLEKISNTQNLSLQDEAIDYIVIFYNDGTFKKYRSKK